MTLRDPAARPNAPDFCNGGGEAGALIRAHGWSSSPLGAPDGWSQPLKTLVGVMLAANQPMFIVWGPERTLLYNDAYSEILAAKHPTAMGCDFLEVWHEIRADLLPIVEKAYGGEPVQMEDIELWMERKGFREEAHFAFSYTPVRDEGGAVAGFFCPCVEITSQVLADRRRAADTERQRRLFEQAPGFITILTGPDHVFEFVNAAYRRLFGDREYVGKSVPEVFPELADQAFFELLDRVYATGDRFVADRIPIRLDQAEERFLDFIYEPVTDEAGRVNGIFVEGHDVTDAYHADTDLRATTARLKESVAAADRKAAELRAVLESMPDAVYIGTVEGITIANQAALDQLGFSNREDLSRNVATLAAEIQTRNPETGEFIAVDDQAFTRAIRGERVVQDVSVRHRLTGEERIVRCAAAPVSIDGEVIAAVAVNTDVTDRRRIEAGLRESEARLAFLDRLGAETAELAVADAVLATTTQLLGEHLGVSVCAYADMDEDQDGFTIRGDWAAPGAPSIVGHYSLADFGKLAVKNLGAGLPLVINDNLRELAPEEAATFQNIGIAATICMPLIKEGRLTALMAIHDRAPRVWTTAELGLLREVTERSWAHVERVAAAAALRESEARLRFALDGARIGTWDWDLRTLRGSWSPRTMEILGVNDGEDVTPERRAETIHPDDRERVWRDVAEAVRTGDELVSDYRAVRPDGEIRWIASRGAVERDEAGVPVRAAGIVFDITERASAEAAMRESEAVLLRRSEQLQGLADAALVVAQAPSLEATLDGITHAARRIIGAHQGVVSLTRGSNWRQAINSVALTSKYEQWRDYADLPDGSGIYAWLCEHNRPVRMTQAELEAHPRWRGFGAHASEHLPMRGWLAAPLIGRDGRNLGLIQLSDKEDGSEFDAADEAILVQFAQIASAAVDQAQSEAALRNSNARFRAAIDAIEGVLWTNDASGQMVGEQLGWAALTGQEQAEYEGHGWASAIHPDDAHATVAAWNEAVAERKTFVFQHRVRRRDGEWRLFSIRAVPVMDPDGQVREWVGVHADITDQERAKLELREETRTLETLNRTGEALAGELDLERLVQMVTDAGVELTGARFGAFFYNVLGDNGDRFMLYTLSGAERSAFEKFGMPRATAVFGPTFRNEGVVRADDILADPRYGQNGPHNGMPAGHLQVRSYLAVPVVSRTGEVIGGLFFGHPEPGRFTERHERLMAGIAAQAAISIDNARLFQAVQKANDTLEQRVAARTAERNRVWEMSRDLFAIIGFDGRLKAVNPAWRTTLGRDTDAILSVSFRDQVHPEDHAAVQAIVEQLQQGQAVERYEDRLLHADGSWRWISWTLVPGGDVFYAVGRDVTAEKAAAAELENAQEALRQSQKMEAMGQLTGGVAHDFNNLLTPIVGALDLLQRKELGGEREQRLIAGAAQSAERAKTLVQRLLAFARRQPLQPTRVDVSRLVTGMADLVASTTGPQIKVVLETANELPPAKADANQLEMALLNLSVNARDAMPEGGTLRISARAEDVGVSHQTKLRPGRYVRLSVADTGAGMSEATLARAVEPFFSTKGVGKGTGLGLSMVHGLASQLGGALAIQSRPGLGTNIELWLPASDAPSEAAEAGGGGVAAPVASGTALLVDDEELVRLTTADMLHDLGYKVVEASSAEDALRLLADGLHLDVLVTDHLMPGMNGTDLARTARADRPTLKVLIVSGYAEAEGVAPDLPRLTKPFKRSDLAAAIVGL